MNVTPTPALLQALSPQPATSKTQAPPAAQAAEQVLAARKAAGAPRHARGPDVPLPPKPFLDSGAAEDARNLPRGSLLDIVV